METNNYAELYAEICRRKSVRRYESRELDETMRAEIDAAIRDVPGINDAPVALRLLSSGEAGVNAFSAPYCLAAYTEGSMDGMLNAAFKLEYLTLCLSLAGLGSCWIGMAKPKGALMNYQGLPFYKLFVFGYPGESLRRESLSQFKRKSIAAISNQTETDEILEAVRFAPSAMNRQGWYIEKSDKKLRLHMAADNFLVKKWMQPMTVADAGIALCHIWIAAQKTGCYGSAYREDGVGTAKKNYGYVLTMELG
jgi:hypothetical protein